MHRDRTAKVARTGALTGVLFLLLAACAFGAPERIRYQGRLVDASGPVTGTRSFTFRFYLEPEGGKSLYSETQSVPVQDGYYAVEIGASNAVPGALRAVFSREPVYLEVTVGKATLSPREEIGSAPRAFTAETVSPDGITSEMIALNAVRDAELDPDAAVRSLNGLKGDLILEGVGIDVTTGVSNIVLAAEGFAGRSAQQRTARLPVAQGQAVAAGDVVTLYNGQVMAGWWTAPSGVASNAEPDVDCAALDAEHAVVVWRSGLTGHSGGMRLGTLSDRTWSWGPAANFEAAGAAEVCVAALDDQRFVVAYRDEYSSNWGTARIGFRNGGATLWRGDPFIFNSNATHHIAVTALTTSRYAVAYQASDGSGWCTVADAGPEDTLDAWRVEFMSDVSDIALAAWPPTHQTDRTHHLVVAFRNGYSGGNGSIMPIRVVDEDLFLGEESYYDFTGDPASDLATVTLDDDLFAVAWRDDDTGQGWAILGEKYVYSIGYGGYRWRPIWGTTSQFHRGSTSDLVMRSVDGRNVSLGYREGTRARHRWGRLGNDAPRSVEWAWENVCGPFTFGGYAWALFQDNRILAAFGQGSDIDIRLGLFGRVAGVAAVDATAGQYGPVVASGLTDPAFTLTADRVYSHDGAGNLVHPGDAVAQPIGLAVDPHRLLVAPDLEAAP